MRSVKSERLGRTILFGEGMLRRALREYGAHFHRERPHHGLGYELIERGEAPATVVGEGVDFEAGFVERAG